MIKPHRERLRCSCQLTIRRFENLIALKRMNPSPSFFVAQYLSMSPSNYRERTRSLLGTFVQTKYADKSHLRSLYDVQKVPDTTLLQGLGRYGLLFSRMCSIVLGLYDVSSQRIYEILNLFLELYMDKPQYRLQPRFAAPNPAVRLHQSDETDRFDSLGDVLEQLQKERDI